MEQSFHPPPAAAERAALRGLHVDSSTPSLLSMSEVIIETVDLHRSYRIGKKSIEVLHGIDLQIRQGEKVFLCGPSGAGKTTLLYTLAGLEHPEKGSVRIDGTDLYAMARRQQAQFRNLRIGYVFQNYHLLPELTALENVAVPGAIAGKDTTELALKALGRVGLKDRGDHLPAELSGGEQQRVAIARAIVNHPKVLFADEPTGNLDSRTSAEIMTILMDLAAEQGMTLVVVTHDQNLAKTGDRRLVIQDGTIHEPATV
jgi:predicted ABC-type transport system involved in lysophospholipase L1 biosynthesis ATPase subunit